jgi:sugar/nucleoside kinase (ribokinase family)
MTGGEAANSSVVLSRLGVRVKLDGNCLGTDDGGRRTKAFLSDYGIDTSRLPLTEGYEGVQEVVFAAAGTRTIFGTYCRLQEDAKWNMPVEEDITGAKVVCLDPFFREASARVARIANDADIPVVTVDCSYDAPLLRRISAVVIAESYIRENYPDRQIDDLFHEYQRATSGLVIFTFGAGAIWYARPGQAIRHSDPYAIDPVDTTGGGDAFRAGIVYGFLQGWDDDQMIDFAAALAALVCTRFPGVLDSPGIDDVLMFMRKD